MFSFEIRNFAWHLPLQTFSEKERRREKQSNEQLVSCQIHRDETSWSLKEPRDEDNKKAENLSTDLKHCVVLPLYDLIQLGKEDNQHDTAEDGENTSENLNTCIIQ